MQEAGVDRFVFSSTCAVYGDPDRVPITEDEKKAPVSPYGRSKWMVEQILQDLPPAWRLIVTLRYNEDLSYEEIGQLLNMPPATVGTSLLRARRRLRAALSGT